MTFYCPLEVQRQYFAKALQTRSKDYEEDDPWLLEAAHLLAACPDVAGHPTGGAVDVTIFNKKTGKDVDLGVPVYREAIHKAGKKIYYRSPEISLEATQNRELLRRVMEGIGFAPFDGEFWHFSYGDREWAAITGAPEALYDQLELEGVKKSLD